jgi:DNA-binding NarL/FixJ family response regulator
LVVTVIDHCPVYRHGLVRALEEAGYSVDGAAPSSEVSSDLTVAVVRSDEDRRRLASIDAEPLVVAVLEDESPQGYAEALAAGASVVVAEDAPVTQVVEALEAAIAGRAVLPIPVVRQLARGAERCRPPLSEEEIAWLRKLAHGVPVSQLAEESFHSERDMYRILGRLYARIGVAGRAEAIVAATRWGFVD